MFSFKEDLLRELIVEENKAVERIKLAIRSTILDTYTGRDVYEITVKDFAILEHGLNAEDYHTTKQKYNIESLTLKIR